MNKNRLIITALTGTIALTALSLSLSLAWYANSDRMTVGNIDLSLNAEHNLFISTSSDIDSFKRELKKEDLLQVDEFAPVSAMYQSRWMANKPDKPVFYDTSSPAVPSSGIPELKEMTSGFYQQEFYLLSDMIFDYYATISGVDCFVSGDEEANLLRAQALHEEIPELSVEEIQANLNSLAKSLRVSILVPETDFYRYYVVDPTKEADNPTYYAGRLDNSQDGYYDTYETTENGNSIVEKEVIFGEVNNRDKIVYDTPISASLPDDLDFNTSHKKFFGNSFNGKSKETAFTFNEEKSLEAGVSYVEEPSFSVSDLEDTDNNQLLIPLRVATPTKIVVSIYIEGWDKDCFNATMGASFISTLSFKLLRRI